jgi:hypothetical protein
MLHFRQLSYDKIIHVTIALLCAFLCASFTYFLARSSHVTHRAVNHEAQKDLDLQQLQQQKQQLFALSKQELRAYFLEGLEQHRQGHSTKSVTIFQLFAHAFPDSSYPKMALLISELQSPQSREKLHTLTQELAYAPAQHPYQDVLIALAYYRLGHFHLSRKHLQKYSFSEQNKNTAPRQQFADRIVAHLNVLIDAYPTWLRP